MTTNAPSSAQRRAVAWPMPVPAAAVTSTVRPSSSACPRESGPSISASRPRLGRKSQHPLADDVALDLVGPPVDGVGAREQEHALQLLVELEVGPEHVHRQLTQVAVP